jgi:hypothetical protein
MKKLLLAIIIILIFDLSCFISYEILHSYLLLHLSQFVNSLIVIMGGGLVYAIIMLILSIIVTIGNYFLDKKIKYHFLDKK